MTFGSSIRKYIKIASKSLKKIENWQKIILIRTLNINLSDSLLTLIAVLRYIRYTNYYTTTITIESLGSEKNESNKPGKFQNFDDENK